MSVPATIRVAAAQLSANRLDAAAANLAAIEQAVGEAAARGVDLLVLPEGAYPAYWLGGVEAYRRADTLSSAAFVDHLASLARKHRVSLVCGFVEDTGTHLYNAAVVIDAQGRECGRHRKSFLWGEEIGWFRPGDRIAPIKTPLGRIGVMICADGRAPEIAAGLVAQGARLIVVPTCWVNVADRPGEYRNAQAEFLIEGRARECRVPFVAADKFGEERVDFGYVGQSMIVGADGQMLARAPSDAPALIEAEVSLPRPRPAEIPFWAERRIFSADPAVPPDAEGLEPLRIGVLPACLNAGVRPAESGEDALQTLAAQGVQLLAAHFASPELAERIEVYGRSLGMVVVGYPYVERPMFEQFGGYGAVASKHLRSFVAARVMALDGAAILFVMGEEVALSLLRTRAVENRVFLAAAFRESAVLVSPTGEVVDSCAADAPRPLVADIDLRASADKYAYPDTHIWQQRRPAVYQAAFGVHAEFRATV